MKYETGSYAVILFDEVGSKIGVKYGYKTLDQATEIAENEEVASYAVTRVIKNSKFSYATWKTND